MLAKTMVCGEYERSALPWHYSTVSHAN